MKDDDIVWDDEDIVWDNKSQKRSIPQELSRQAGLALRYGVQGLASLPGMFIDPFQKLAGAQTTSGAVSNALDSLGVPKPESGAERIAGAGSEAIAGGAPFLAAANVASQGVKAVPFVRSMLSRPVSDTAATATGGLASEAVREAGGPEWAAWIAGAAAPMGTGAVASATGAANQVRKEIFRPVTKAGQKQIAADVVGRLVQDKTAALGNLSKYNNLKQLEANTGAPVVGVRGAKPTAGAVSADYGLVGAEQLLARGEAGPAFSMQRGANNAAQLDELARLRATESKLAEYAKRRDDYTKPLRDAAFGNTRGPVNVDAVLDEVFRTFRSDKAQGQDAKRALEYIYDRLEKAKAEGATSPADLYNGLHKDLNQMVGKGLDSENGRIRLAAGVATGIKNRLADEIEKAAPGFRKYLAAYARLSKPIERLEFVTERLGGENLSRVTNSLPQIGPDGPQFSLSQAKMRNAVGDIEKNVSLAPYQRDVLGRVMGDLNSQELASRGGKPPGSDTYQNIAAANFVSRILGQTLGESGAGKTVQRPLNLAYKPFEAGINDLIVAAFQDPKKMEELLRMARTSRQSPSLTGLLGTGVSRSTEGLLGSLLAQ